MAKKNELITIDFETKGIKSRPAYPPQPVGVSIKHRGKAPRYFAWGHPTKNNCTKEQAGAALKDAYRAGVPLLFHNAKFDVDVAEAGFGLKVPDWQLIHDTLYLLFLHDPHARSLSLKPSAERMLNMPPEERDVVHDWLVEHKIIRKNQKDGGAYISEAPGDVVGAYANGDVVRTEKLYDLLMGKVMAAGMQKAYDRERQLMPIMLENEREGLRVDVRALEHDEKLYTAAQEKADVWLRKRLKAPELNLDSNDELADALEATGVVTEFVATKTGKRSTAKKNLTEDLFHDKKVFGVLGYRNRLGTCLQTFIRPWLEMARASAGRIYTSWNQVRQAHGDDASKGTRTGRLSCSPNFMNVPKDWFDKNDGFTEALWALVLKTVPGLPPLPMMRKYILADENGLFLHRDYSQQEPRILGHFEGDRLCKQYNDDPNTDFHVFAQNMIAQEAGLTLERRAVKAVNLALMYAMGIGALAEKLDVDYATAKRIKAAHRQALPGLAELEEECKRRGQAGEPIRTWGGRLYHVEPPKVIEGRLRTFEYKLPNVLIQGSAADCTKEAIIRYHNHPKRRGRFLVTVHDENNASSPAEKNARLRKIAAKEELLVLREAMESVEFDVPMRSDAGMGPNWGELEDVKEAR